MFVYELGGCQLESRCSHVNFRYRTFFKKRVSWHSGNSRVWIYSGIRTWLDKNIQLSSESRVIGSYEITLSELSNIGRLKIDQSVYFCSAKTMDSLTLRRHDSFQNWNNRKDTHCFPPRPLIFKLQQKDLKSNGICMSWSTPETDLKLKLSIFLNSNFEVNNWHSFTYLTYFFLELDFLLLKYIYLKYIKHTE